MERQRGGMGAGRAVGGADIGGVIGAVVDEASMMGVCGDLGATDVSSG
jgi:hypothetical protein